ncbi:uncharacterized protein LOC107860342 [Capsicum annuum]|uniref:uncharacterized protein LOC107860342 n=1 Tax=Capsicum annuum TaxID=4072 RepID=UPI001FB10878|nr:uncharacterized protein LOC107860342 [Capsicum annuum]
MEAFIGLVHVKDTSALSLKKAIVDVLAHHSLTLAYVRGQCYNGASNMQGELVLLTSNILNVLGASFKRVDKFREYQKEKLQEELDMGELETGRGLNQELGLIKAGDTRWESHYKSFKNFISNLASIVDVLDSLVENARITNDLNVSLQKKEQDIANAMILVKVAKRRLQALRDNEWDPIFKKTVGWDSLKEKVEKFCIKHSIPLPKYDEPCANSGRSRRKVVDYTTLHHYRVDVFYKIIDWQLQELNDRFNEVTSDLLNGEACLNPIDTFSSFDIQKILVMAKLYPDDFDEFSNLGGLGELSRKLVEKKKHLTYPLVFLLVKFALLLPVVTASVEKVFSAMKYIKNDLQNRMDDEFLYGCIVPYIEKRVFKNISNECIIETFQGMKRRRMHL